ncbi:MAG: hypothetical protein H0Z16_03080 [Thermodesulfobacterium sp.]|nr:hypothetical protein [Thermodesulfobacterium sp.]
MNKKAVILSVFLSVVLSALMLTGYHFFVFERERERIKTFDLTGHLSLLQKAYLSGKLNKSELETILDDIKKKLDKEIEKNKGKVIILPKEIVINSDKRKDIEIKYENEKFRKAVNAYIEELKKQTEK